jgi:multidrug efflux system membrane fusion protein
MNGDNQTGIALPKAIDRREERPQRPSGAPRWRPVITLVVILFVVAGGAASFALYTRLWQRTAPVVTAEPPHVTVSAPVVRQLRTRADFLGQLSAVDRVEIRAQVGGTLSEIHFTDGQIVHKGDLLFVIDTRPFEIRLHEATSTLKSAQARLVLSNVELWRAQQLKKTEFGTTQTVDQQQAEQQASEAAVESAAQAVLDAQLDLEYCHVTAPFTGRISNHLVSVGSLVSGSRAGSSPTTLLTTLVSLDPIYLDFDMSETDFIRYQATQKDSTQNGLIAFNLTGDSRVHRGNLDFIDNAINRGSGTIHARATVDNSDLSLVPGEFAQLQLTTGSPATALLIPDASVSLDQSDHVVMTVAADGTVAPKQVVLGGRFAGLRIIREGLAPTDRVIIDGQVHARPGAVVTADQGSVSLNLAD